MRKTHSPNPKGTSEVRGRISLPSVRISQWRRPSDYWTLLYSILILIKWGPYLKNKGLEFPGVFGCYPLLNWCQIGLLFITLTRAKQQPHLFCFILDSSWMKKNWLSYLIPVSQSWRFAFSTLRAGRPLSQATGRVRNTRTDCALASQQQWLQWAPGDHPAHWLNPACQLLIMKLCKYEARISQLTILQWEKVCLLMYNSRANISHREAKCTPFFNLK